MDDRIYLVQFNDYLEQRVLGGYQKLRDAELFVEAQRPEGYGWYEIIELTLEKPYATKMISKKFFSGGKEVEEPEQEFEDYGYEEDPVWEEEED